jgi:hypothetical protein|tara:strand:+ start:1377 stop:1751 length:375 start_codon:yes stop_codon:yes gene_type:complete
MSIDINGEITVADLDKPDVHTSTATGTGLDISSYEGKIKVTLICGTVGGTSPTNACKIQDSADDSTYADVTGATFTTVTASNSNESIAVDTRGVNKYIRSVQTIGGTSPTFDSVVVTAGIKKVR